MFKKSSQSISSWNSTYNFFVEFDSISHVDAKSMGFIQLIHQSNGQKLTCSNFLFVNNIMKCYHNFSNEKICVLF